MQECAQRKKVVAWALSMTENTVYAPSSYERSLLEHYIQGALSIDQVLDLLEEEQASQPGRQVA